MRKAVVVLSVVLFFGASNANAIFTCNCWNSGGGNVATGTCNTGLTSTCGINGYTGPKCTSCTPSEMPEIAVKEQTNVADNDPNTDYAFKGYLNNVLKSPSNGRATSAKAILDTCWNNGYSTTDNLTDNSGCYSACDNGTTNYSCSGLTGADSCYTRCDNVFGTM